MIVVASSHFADTPMPGNYTIDIRSGTFDALDTKTALPVEAGAIAASGSSVFTFGTLHQARDVWDKPFSGCSAGDGTADHYFEVHLLQNTSGAAQTVDLTATFANGGAFNVFRGAFDKNAPTTNCFPTQGSYTTSGTTPASFSGLSLAAGETITVVVSDFVGGTTGEGNFMLEVATQ